MSQSLHPFSDPLDELSLEEIDERHSKLMTRWYTARRMQMSESIIFQLDLLITSLEEEKVRRNKVEEKPPNPVLIDTDPIIIDRKRKF